MKEYTAHITQPWTKIFPVLITILVFFKTYSRSVRSFFSSKIDTARVNQDVNENFNEYLHSNVRIFSHQRVYFHSRNVILHRSIFVHDARVGNFVYVYVFLFFRQLEMEKALLEGELRSENDKLNSSETLLTKCNERMAQCEQQIETCSKQQIERRDHNKSIINEQQNKLNV